MSRGSGGFNNGCEIVRFIMNRIGSCSGLETHKRQMCMGRRDQTEARVDIHVSGGSCLHQVHSHRMGGGKELRVLAWWLGWLAPLDHASRISTSLTSPSWLQVSSRLLFKVRIPAGENRAFADLVHVLWTVGWTNCGRIVTRKQKLWNQADLGFVTLN